MIITKGYGNNQMVITKGYGTSKIMREVIHITSTINQTIAVESKYDF